MLIDRKKLVSRHNPLIYRVEPLSPLSVGNGEFAFTADFTGLQTFPNEYEVPLGTQSEWGWHYTDFQTKYRLEDIKQKTFSFHNRNVAYPLYSEDSEDAYHWLRQNPHRLQLGQISFRLLKDNYEQVEIRDITAIKQQLNLWEGVLLSEFTVENQPVFVTTVCHPTRDQVAVKVISPLITNGRLQIMIRFPAPTMNSQIWEESIHLNWQDSDAHQTIIKEKNTNALKLYRKMDEDHYFVSWQWSTGAIQAVNEHEYWLTPTNETEELTFTVSFSKEGRNPYSFDEIVAESKHYWFTFWNSGAAIDFSESSDERANELERRVILSQFLTAIHCSGSSPPQETGYMYNSWFGKFHLEMHWWHGAHFPLWGRGHLLNKSLQWYKRILPIAKELATSQGYKGARWPKMVGIDGRQSPSPIAPVLIWQQPHLLSLLELLYQENPSKEIVEKWREIVIETANFMASFSVWDAKKQAFTLGPPLIPAQECHKPESSFNPPYELEYWKYGLTIAKKWLERLNEPVPAKWEDMIKNIASPPQHNGVYLAHEGCLDTFTLYNHDHPSMVGALGILPGSLINKKIMKQTLQKVRDEWQWETAWGWDFPMCAMTAARLGEPELAIEFLLMNATKNTYLPNGHNYQSPNLTAYLPGNGGLLTAVAMMARGWRDSITEHAPGFPQNGEWVIQAEGLHPLR